MTHAEKENEARHSSCRGMAASSFGFFAVKGMCRNVPPCSKIDTRFIGATWPERERQRGFKPYTQNTGRSRLDKQSQSPCSSPRIARTRLADSNSERFPLGLQPVCNNAISATLRSIQARRFSWKLSSHGLHGGGRDACKTPYFRKSGSLEACQKNANGSPATERCMPKTFRHGTMQEIVKGKTRHFVPPRNETPCFSCCHRSATGHLYRFTICIVILWCSGNVEVMQSEPSSVEVF